MKIRTVSATLGAPSDAVFRFLAEIENLPRWATEFCERVERRPDGWIAHTSQGPMRFRIIADRSTGLLDMWGGPSPEEMALFPVRVIEAPDGSTLVSFTFMQSPGLPDEVYERQYRSLLIEVQGLIERFGGGELHAPNVPVALQTAEQPTCAS
jgi:hypothetical protein